MMSEKLSEILKDHQFCLLETFRKSGVGVKCPMWFTLRDEALYMTTRGQSWKVKRIRNNPKVSVGWSNSSGSKHGKLFSGTATLVPNGEEFEDAVRSLNKKYGLKKKLIDFGLRFSKDKTEAILKIELD